MCLLFFIFHQRDEERGGSLSEAIQSFRHFPDNSFAQNREQFASECEFVHGIDVPIHTHTDSCMLRPVIESQPDDNIILILLDYLLLFATGIKSSVRRVKNERKNCDIFMRLQRVPEKIFIQI